MFLRIYILLTAFLLIRKAQAQETIYFANGDRLPNARLTDATDEKVVLTVQRDNGPAVYKFGRSNVLLAFNNAGDFLAISTLPADAAGAKQQIEQFANVPASPRKSDFLIKAVPLTVIPAQISYESDDVINYKTAQGGAASINKSELVAIFYRDGRHAITGNVTEVAPLLADIRRQINAGDNVATAAPNNVAVESATTQPMATTSTATSTTSAVQPAVAQAVETSATTSVTAAPVASTDKATVSVDKAHSLKSKPTLSDEDYKTYRTKALRKVDEFASYLSVITNKDLTGDEKDKAIDQAAKLFMTTATIEVTSASRAGSRKYPIREYLTRLKLLPYNSAKVEWSEIQYIKELTQATDGNYYGTITGQQTFTGYGQGSDVLYSDVTQKNVRVKLQSYQKLVDGQGQVNWDVLLGNIGVANN